MPIDRTYRQHVVVVPSRSHNNFHGVPVRQARVGGISGGVLLGALPESADVARRRDHNNILDVHRVPQGSTQGTVVERRHIADAGDR